MNILSTILIALLTVMFFAAVASKLALKLKLIDQNAGHDSINRQVPLIGGPVLCATFLAGAALGEYAGVLQMLVPASESFWIISFCGLALVMTGVLDDKFNAGILPRLLLEVTIALILIIALDLRLVNLGNLFGTGDVMLPEASSVFFTTAVIVGVINAFNMMDGVDGLLISLTLTGVCSWYLFFEELRTLETFFITATLTGFLAINFGKVLFIPRSFLGDSGARLLGFLAVIALIDLGSGQLGERRSISPAAILYLIAVPLLDMSRVTMLRALSGKNPFVGDKWHIHHLIMGVYDNPLLVSSILAFVQLLFSILAIYFTVNAYEEWQIFSTFLLTYAGYIYTASRLQRHFR